MRLASLRLRNVRVHSDSLIQFEPGINLIHGPNAAGKTTILEAIHMLMIGRSFRTSQSADLISQGTTGLQIEAKLTKHDVEQELKLTFDGKERTIYQNNTPIRKLTNLFGIIQGVVMTPDDVVLIKGGPSGRRGYLDVQLSQTDPAYLAHLSRYVRATRQRNHLLKSGDISTIESWETEMAGAAAYIVCQRYAAVHDLKKLVRELYYSLSKETKEMDISYHSAAPQDTEAVIRQHYLEKYNTLRSKEIERGMTLSGPHRDDLIVTIGGMDARHFASEGQQRSSTATLKLAEWERMRQLTQIIPLMLIDDVGVSLDESRRRRLFELIGGLGQVFLTGTEGAVPGMKTHSLNLQCG